MITREEYEASMKQIRTIRGAITPMSNYIDSLEQHIKELKSKLQSNPSQLTCEGCIYSLEGGSYNHKSSFCKDCFRSGWSDNYEQKEPK